MTKVRHMNDLELRRALQELSASRSDAAPVVSLYLDIRWSDEKQRERARVFVRAAAKQALERHAAHPQLEALRRTLARVEREAQKRAQEHGEGRGLAVFACETPRLWRTLVAPQPFKDELCVDGRPHLVQLARLADDVEPALVAFVDDRGARIYEVALGAVVNESSVEGEVSPRRSGPGGRVRGGAGPSALGASGGVQYERDSKNERHLEELIQRVRREAVDFLRHLWERSPRQHLVLVGTAEKVAAFERELPPRMAEKVLARLPRPPGQGTAALAEQVVARLAEREREVEKMQVEHAIGEALRGGLAVLGPEAVVLAVNERRVQRLILEEDFERAGWRCLNCQALGMNRDEVCSYCQGPLVRVEALGEELVGRVLAEAGEVEVVTHTNRLHAYDGLAALLRQARASASSGAPPAAPP